MGGELSNSGGPGVTNPDFVRLLYQNILQRSPDDAGYNYWVSEIEQSGNRGGMIVSFSNSGEYIDLTEDAMNNFLANVPLDGYILI